MSTKPKMNRTSKLTDEQRDELHAEIRKGQPINRLELAKKYGISEAGIGYHVGLVNGTKSPSRMGRSAKPGVPSIVINTPDQALEAMNADILAGDMTLDQIAEKYGTTRGKVWERKKKVRASEEPAIVLDDEQMKRAVLMLGRVAERKPAIFTELVGIMSKKYPTLWIEVL